MDNFIKRVGNIVPVKWEQGEVSSLFDDESEKKNKENVINYFVTDLKDGLLKERVYLKNDAEGYLDEMNRIDLVTRLEYDDIDLETDSFEEIYEKGNKSKSHTRNGLILQGVYQRLREK